MTVSKKFLSLAMIVAFAALTAAAQEGKSEAQLRTVHGVVIQVRKPRFRKRGFSQEYEDKRGTELVYGQYGEVPLQRPGPQCRL